MTSAERVFLSGVSRSVSSLEEMDFGDACLRTTTSKDPFARVEISVIETEEDKAAFGTSAQVHQAYEALRSAIGEIKRVPRLEFVDTLENPVLEDVRTALAEIPAFTDEVQAIRTIVALWEKHSKQPLLDPTVKPKIRTPELFSAFKLCQMIQHNRTVNQLSEGFSTAEAVQLGGRQIEARNVFYQRWSPLGLFENETVLIVPGEQETGRSVSAMAAYLSGKGYFVVVIDHQAAGQTGRGDGTIDSGMGLARDIAAVAHHALRFPTVKFSLVGSGMCGAATFALMVLKKTDQLPKELDFPKPQRVVLLAPFFDMAPGALNRVIKFVSKIPFLNRISMPNLGIPISALVTAIEDFAYTQNIALHHQLKMPEMRTIRGTGDVLASDAEAQNVINDVLLAL